MDDRPVLELHYVAKHSTGMYGVLIDIREELPICVTVQRDDEGFYFSKGIYDCVRDFYYHGNYPTFEILVPGHTRILFHKGNHEEDSKLCVVLGEKFSKVEGKFGVAESAEAFQEFWDRYKTLERFKMAVTSLV